MAPPALQPEQQATLKAAVAGTPEQVGVPLAHWTWRGVQQFLRDRFGLELSRSSCLRWLHRLNFTWKRPKKRLLKADAKKRTAFVHQYITLRAEALALDDYSSTEASVAFLQQVRAKYADPRSHLLG